MLKPALTIAVLSLVATQANAGWEQVTSKAVLSANVVGNEYVNPSNGAWFSFRADGSLDGGYQGKSMTGKWRWSGGKVCFTRALAGKALPKDCVTVHMDGSKIVTTKNNGKGKQTQYRRR